MINPTEIAHRRRLHKRNSQKNDRRDNPLLLDASLMSTIPRHLAKVPAPAQLLEEGLNNTMKSISESLNFFDSSSPSRRPNTNARGPSRNSNNYRNSSRYHQQRNRSNSDHHSISSSVISSIARRPPSALNKNAARGSQKQQQSYSGVRIAGILGSLTLTEESLLFKPRDPRDKDNIFSWQVESIQKHQISAPNTGSNLLRFSTSPSNPVVTVSFRDRASLENINSHLNNKLQPLRKYRRLKETLLTTQRKLKEANRDIDELQDDNRTLLHTCETFGRKCKELNEDLKEARRKEVQQFINTDKVAQLEEKIQTMRPEVETLRNEQTAMTICHEMDIETYKSRIETLEKELAEDREALEEARAATERLLEEREPMDGMQIEVHRLTKDLRDERRTVKELQSKLELQEQVHGRMGEVRRQRNNAYLELARVKRERDNLQRQLGEYHQAPRHLLDLERVKKERDNLRRQLEEYHKARQSSPEETWEDQWERDLQIEQSTTVEQRELSVVASGCDETIDAVVLSSPVQREEDLTLASFQDQLAPLRWGLGNGNGNGSVGTMAELDAKRRPPTMRSESLTTSRDDWLPKDMKARKFANPLVCNTSPSTVLPLVHSAWLAGAVAVRVPLEGHIVQLPEDWSFEGLPVNTARPLRGASNAFALGRDSELKDEVTLVESSPYPFTQVTLGDPMALLGDPMGIHHCVLPDRTPVGTAGRDQRLSQHLVTRMLLDKTVVSWDQDPVESRPGTGFGPSGLGS